MPMAEIMFLLLLALLILAKFYISFCQIYKDFEFFSKIFFAAVLYILELLIICSIAGASSKFNVNFITTLSAAALLVNLLVIISLQKYYPNSTTQIKSPLCFVSIGLFLLTTIFYLPPSQIVIGGQDPSLYVAAASTLAKHENATVTLPAHALFSENERSQLFDLNNDPARYNWPYAGAYLFNNSIPTLQFDFIRGPSYLLALGFLVTDGLKIWQQRAFLTNTTYSVLAVFCFYLLLQTFLDNKLWATAGAILLLFCPAEIWFGRANYSEVSAQLLLLFSLLNLALLERAKPSFRFPYLAISIIATIASFSMRADHLSAVLVLLLLLPFFCAFSISKKQLISAQLLLVALFFLAVNEFKATGPLYLWRMGRQSIFLKDMEVFVLATFVISQFFYIAKVRSFITSFCKKFISFVSSNPFSLLFSIAAIFLLSWGLFYRPIAEPFEFFGPNAHHNANVRTMDEDIFLRLGILVGFPVFILGFWGAKNFFIKEKNSLTLLIIIILLAAYCSELLFNQKNSPMLYWASRRYLPLLVPAFIFFGIFQLSRLNLFEAKQKNYLLQAALYLGSIVPMWLLGQHLYWQGEMNGAMSVAEELRNRLDHRSTVLLADKSQMNENFTLQFIGHFEVLQIKGLNEMTPEAVSKVSLISERLKQAGLNLVIIANKRESFERIKSLSTKGEGTIIHPYRRLGENMTKFPDSPTINEFKVYYGLL